MQRISSSTRQINKHGSGKDGFTNGSPGVAPATSLNAEFFDAVQEELALAIEGEGYSLDGTHTQLATILAGINQGVFGDGSDSDVTITGTATLVRDMYYNNLTISGAGTLNTNGFRIFVKGTLTLADTATISARGKDGAGPLAGGTAYTVGTLEAGYAGGKGGTPTGTVSAGGISTSYSIGGNGGAGGNGNGGGAGSSGGSAVAIPAEAGHIRHSPGWLGFVFSATTDVRQRVRGGAGGGGGGEGTTGSSEGGGGGGGGGIVSICARKIITVAGTTITARGGAGADGTGDAAGGGGGGGGGVLIASRYRNIAGTVTAAGGAAGAFGAITASLAAAGSPGLIVYFSV